MVRNAGVPNNIKTGWCIKDYPLSFLIREQYSPVVFIFVQLAFSNKRNDFIIKGLPDQNCACIDNAANVQLQWLLHEANPQICILFLLLLLLGYFMDSQRILYRQHQHLAVCAFYLVNLCVLIGEVVIDGPSVVLGPWEPHGFLWKPQIPTRGSYWVDILQQVIREKAMYQPKYYCISVVFIYFVKESFLFLGLDIYLFVSHYLFRPFVLGQGVKPQAIIVLFWACGQLV